MTQHHKSHQRTYRASLIHLCSVLVSEETRCVNKKRHSKISRRSSINKACDDAVFVRHVSQGHFFITIPDACVAGYGSTNSCQEETYPRNDDRVQPKGFSGSQYYKMELYVNVVFLRGPSKLAMSITTVPVRRYLVIDTAKSSGSTSTWSTSCTRTRSPVIGQLVIGSSPIASPKTASARAMVIQDRIQQRTLKRIADIPVLRW